MNERYKAYSPKANQDEITTLKYPIIPKSWKTELVILTLFNTD